MMTSIEELRRTAVQLGSDIQSIQDKITQLRNDLNNLAEVKKPYKLPTTSGTMFEEPKGSWINYKLYIENKPFLVNLLAINDTDRLIKLEFASRNDALKGLLKIVQDLVGCED